MPRAMAMAPLYYPGPYYGPGYFGPTVVVGGGWGWGAVTTGAGIAIGKGSA